MNGGIKETNKGDKGDKGDTGNAGKDFNYWILSYACRASNPLLLIPIPAMLTGVGTSAPYDIHIWDGINLNWANNGTILAGPQGNPGTKG